MSEFFNNYLDKLNTIAKKIERCEIAEHQLINTAFSLGELDGNAFADYVVNSLTEDEYDTIHRKILDWKLELNMLR